MLPAAADSNLRACVRVAGFAQVRALARVHARVRGCACGCVHVIVLHSMLCTNSLQCML